MSKVDSTKTIVKSVVTLGRGLGMDIVAEGVETKFEAAMMTRFGCTELQGFYFSRPLPVARMVEFLEAFKPTRPDQDLEAADPIDGIGPAG
jgi:EAL domain-containing protein (putative c-di-GMP-specific phosphodiesterase class I)